MEKQKGIPKSETIESYCIRKAKMCEPVIDQLILVELKISRTKDSDIDSLKDELKKVRKYYRRMLKDLLKITS